MPLLEVVGSTGGTDPLHIDPMGVKAGTVVAILKFKQAGGATLPQRSGTEPDTFVRQTWNAPLVVMAGIKVSVILLP